MTIKQVRSLKNKIIKICISACACQFLVCTVIETVRSQHLGEYTVKAAFVYNFTKLIQWPETAFDSGGKNFKIAVFGDEHLKEDFRTIDGKTSAGRIISVQYPDPKAEDDKGGYKKTLAESQIVFISRHTRLEQVSRILNDIGNRPVLTIGEDKNFSRVGGIIQFFTRNDHLHFEINIKSAEAHQLKFSSRLLKLAIIVNEK
ncbi:YfiR family protein [Desulfobacter vibrioformis]|uniref:YfiR family protein n=1 Tax=Desulfobacter vibrioformis TaxID=34031 RepID=UPI00054D1C9D|nr:YfiR family protein [Desulfobacter vibrioformis]